MRKSSLLLLILLTSLSSCDRSTISGRISGLTGDTLHISYSIIRSATDVQSFDDVIIAPKGKFRYDIDHGSSPVVATLMPADGIITKYRVYWPSSSSLNLFITPHERVRIKGSFSDYVLSAKVHGSLLSSQLAEHTAKQSPLDRERTTLTMQIDSARMAGAADEVIGELTEKSRLLSQQMALDRAAYIRANPDSPLSGFYLATSIGYDSVPAYANYLGQTVKDGPLKDMILMSVLQAEEYLTVTRAEKITADGVLAPDFTLEQLNGRQFTLSSLRGKYVVLDFWGSWCKPCVNGMPEMKKYYEKYRSEVEFVSIDCHDDKDIWQSAVDHLGLSWTNVYNSRQDNLEMLYGVTSYPTKILLDPEGRILARFIGERPFFYTELDNLFGKK